MVKIRQITVDPQVYSLRKKVWPSASSPHSPQTLCASIKHIVLDLFLITIKASIPFQISILLREEAPLIWHKTSQPTPFLFSKAYSIKFQPLHKFHQDSKEITLMLLRPFLVCSDFHFPVWAPSHLLLGFQKTYSCYQDHFWSVQTFISLYSLSQTTQKFQSCYFQAYVTIIYSDKLLYWQQLTRYKVTTRVTLKITFVFGLFPLVVGNVICLVLLCLISARRDKVCPLYRVWNWSDTNTLQVPQKPYRPLENMCMIFAYFFWTEIMRFCPRYAWKTEPQYNKWHLLAQDSTCMQGYFMCMKSTTTWPVS